jgi:hypothetical protein
MADNRWPKKSWSGCHQKGRREEDWDLDGWKGSRFSDREMIGRIVDRWRWIAFRNWKMPVMLRSHYIYLVHHIITISIDVCTPSSRHLLNAFHAGFHSLLVNPVVFLQNQISMSAFFDHLVWKSQGVRSRLYGWFSVIPSTFYVTWHSLDFVWYMRSCIVMNAWYWMRVCQNVCAADRFPLSLELQ